MTRHCDGQRDAVSAQQPPEWKRQPREAATTPLLSPAQFERRRQRAGLLSVVLSHEHASLSRSTAPGAHSETVRRNSRRHECRKKGEISAAASHLHNGE